MSMFERLIEMNRNEDKREKLKSQNIDLYKWLFWTCYLFSICVNFYNCYFPVTKVQTLINRAFYDQPHKYCLKFYFPK